MGDGLFTASPRLCGKSASLVFRCAGERGSDVKEYVDGEADGDEAGSGSDSPHHVFVAGGEGKSGDNDGGLGGEHAEEETLATAMMPFGFEVTLAHLQLVEVRDGLIESRLGVVASDAVAKTRGCDVAGE